MTRTNTKRTLFMSALSLLLCVSMLVGSTFAWFTDVAQSTGNKIQAGTLQIELHKKGPSDADYVNVTDSNAAIFDYGYWEPGYSTPMNLKVVNVGTLALKYEMQFQNLNATGNADITDVIEVYQGSSAADISGKTGSNYLGTVKELSKGNVLMSGALRSANGSHDNTGENITESAEISLVLYMPTEVGNDYQGCSATFDVIVRAIQHNFENDGFGNPNYDVNANGSPDHPEFDTPVQGDQGSDTPEENQPYTYKNEDNTFTVDVTAENVANIPQGEKIVHTLTPTSDVQSGVTVSSTQGAYSYDISVKTDLTNKDVPATVTLDIGEGLEGVKVYHKGVAMPDTDYSYDAETGILSITSNAWSPFDIVFNAVATMNGKVYGSVAKAFEEAAKVEGQATIVLLGDADGNGITVPSGSNIVFDLGGNTYDLSGAPAGSSGTKTQAFQLLKGSTVTFKNGTLTASNNAVRMLIQNYADLTLNNMVLDASDNSNIMYALSNSNGSAQILGTSSISVTDGNYAFDIYEWTTGGYGQVNVTVDTTGTITGDIILDSDGATKGTISKLTVKNMNHVGEIINKINTPVDHGAGTAADLKALIDEAFQNGGTGDITITLTRDIDVYNEWDTFAVPNTATNITFDGAGFTIKNLNKPLVTGLWGGHGTLTFKNLTIENAKIEAYNASNVGGSMSAAGAFMAYADAATGIIFNDCHLVNSTISSDAEFVGGLLGYASAPIKITNCSVTNSHITGGKSVGAIIGQDAAAGVMDKITVANSFINSTGIDEGKKYCGTIVGTSNAAASVYTNVTTSGNTINDAASETYYGRAYVGLRINGTEYVQ